MEHARLVGGDVIALIAKRLLQIIPTLIATSLLMFYVLSLGPSPLAQLREFSQLSPEDIAAIVQRYGWDQPLFQQYLDWLKGFLSGDWGTSIRTLQPAVDMIFERLALTLTIASFALVISVGIGLPLGAYVALRSYSKVDYFTTFITLTLMAMPGFFLALLLQIVAVQLRGTTGHVIFYTSGIPDPGAGPVAWAQRLALPIMVLAFTHIAIWVRYQRGELLGVLDQDYIKCARSKGLPERIIFMRHAVRNALLPIITLIAIDMGKLISGAVIIESVFGLPGIGTLLLDSVMGHDTVVVLDILMLIALMMILCNTLADLAYGALDPRVRVG